jgi:gas vesicle protein
MKAEQAKIGKSFEDHKKAIMSCLDDHKKEIMKALADHKQDIEKALADHYASTTGAIEDVQKSLENMNTEIMTRLAEIKSHASMVWLQLTLEHFV